MSAGPRSRQAPKEPVPFFSAGWVLAGLGVPQLVDTSPQSLLHLHVASSLCVCIL